MKSQSLRIIYAGTPDFAVPALRALVGSGYDVVAVYTQPDRRAGRGRKLVHGPVKSAALELGLDVRQPLTMKTEETVAEIDSLAADLMVVAAYGLILPQSVLDLPVHGCINIHASLLPRWRGAAPIQRAIEAGDDCTGITIMQMQAGLDTGDMLFKDSVDIRPEMTAAALHDLLAEMGAAALLRVMDQLRHNQLSAEPQNEAYVTYAHKLDKAEAVLNWSTSSIELHRKVCAYNAWPVAQTAIDQNVLRIWLSEVLKAEQCSAKSGALAEHGTEAGTTEPGTIVGLDDAIDVATGDGVLRLLQVQAPGKKPVTAREYSDRHGLKIGQRIG